MEKTLSQVEDNQQLVGRVARLDTQTAIETLDLEEPSDAARILSALPPARASSATSSSLAFAVSSSSAPR